MPSVADAGPGRASVSDRAGDRTGAHGTSVTTAQEPTAQEPTPRTDIEIATSLVRATSAEGDGPVSGAVLAQAAAALVPGARGASICRGAHGRLTPWAASGDTAHDIDAAQVRAGTGPSWEALVDDASVCVCSDLEADDRWPTLGTAARATGVRGVFAARLTVDDDHGLPYVLTLYTDDAGAFDVVGARHRADTCVALIGLALATALCRDQVRHLTRALASNREIGIGMGVLMAMHRVTRAQAFDLLRVASQNGNRKLRDLASEVADTGTLDVPANRTRRPAATGPSTRRSARRPP